MVKHCQTCGEEGFRKTFIYCTDCWDTIEHIYCLGLSSDNIGEDFSWSCNSCASKGEQWPKMVKYGEKTDTGDRLCGILPGQPVSGMAVVGPIWKGGLRITGKFWGNLEGLEAFMPKFSYSKVVKVLQAMQPSVCFTMKKRDALWPKKFDELGADASHIGLYIFPTSSRGETDYDNLVEFMISNDLAMTSDVGDLELVVFTSLEQQEMELQKIQGNYYLWGILKVIKCHEAKTAKCKKACRPKNRISKCLRGVNSLKKVYNSPLSLALGKAVARSKHNMKHKKMTNPPSSRKCELIPFLSATCRRPRSKRCRKPSSSIKESDVREEVTAALSNSDYQESVSLSRKSSDKITRSLVRPLSQSGETLLRGDASGTKWSPDLTSRILNTPRNVDAASSEELLTQMVLCEAKSDLPSTLKKLANEVGELKQNYSDETMGVEQRCWESDMEIDEPSEHSGSIRDEEHANLPFDSYVNSCDSNAEDQPHSLSASIPSQMPEHQEELLQERNVMQTTNPHKDVCSIRSLDFEEKLKVREASLASEGVVNSRSHEPARVEFSSVVADHQTNVEDKVPDIGTSTGLVQVVPVKVKLENHDISLESSVLERGLNLPINGKMIPCVEDVPTGVVSNSVLTGHDFSIEQKILEVNQTLSGPRPLAAADLPEPLDSAALVLQRPKLQSQKRDVSQAAGLKNGTCFKPFFDHREGLEVQEQINTCLDDKTLGILSNNVVASHQNNVEENVPGISTSTGLIQLTPAQVKLENHDLPLESAVLERGPSLPTNGEISPCADDEHIGVVCNTVLASHDSSIVDKTLKLNQTSSGPRPPAALDSQPLSFATPVLQKLELQPRKRDASQSTDLNNDTCLTPLFDNKEELEVEEKTCRCSYDKPQVDNVVSVHQDNVEDKALGITETKTGLIHLAPVKDEQKMHATIYSTELLEQSPHQVQKSPCCPTSDVLEDVVCRILKLSSEEKSGGLASSLAASCILELNEGGTSRSGTRNSEIENDMVSSSSMLKLADHYHKNSSDSDLTPVGRYMIKSDLAPILAKILDKYGDIAKGCCIMPDDLLEKICKTFHEIEQIRLSDLSCDHVNRIRSVCSLAEALGLDMNWLSKRCDDLEKTALQICQFPNQKIEMNQCTKSREEVLNSKKASVTKLLEEIKSMEEELESTEELKKKVRQELRMSS